jgi:hypothetical protein
VNDSSTGIDDDVQLNSFSHAFERLFQVRAHSIVVMHCLDVSNETSLRKVIGIVYLIPVARIKSDFPGYDSCRRTVRTVRTVESKELGAQIFF